MGYEKCGRKRIRILLQIKCKQCNKIFETYTKKRIFCSLSCSSKYSNSHGGGFTNKAHSIKTKKILSKQRIGIKNVAKRLSVRKKISKALKGRKNTWSIKTKGQKRPNTSKSLIKAYKEGRIKPNKYRKGAYRKDLKQYFRSTWEANYARICNYLKIKWLYEPEVFTLNVNNKEVTYRPDFYLPKYKLYIEVKGYWFSELSKLKYHEFAKTHKSYLVDSQMYNALLLRFKHKIQNWEK